MILIFLKGAPTKRRGEIGILGIVWKRVKLTQWAMRQRPVGFWAI